MSKIVEWLILFVCRSVFIKSFIRLSFHYYNLNAGLFVKFVINIKYFSFNNFIVYTVILIINANTYIIKLI